MSKSDQELFKLANQFQKRIGIRTEKAILADENGRIWEPGQPGYVRVRRIVAGGFSEYITVRLNIVINPIPGTGVRLGYDADNQLAVIALDFAALESQGTNNETNNPADPNSTYFVNQQRLTTFVCHPVSSAANSMLVAVQTGDVIDLASDTLTLFPGAQVDLTSYIPSGAGEWCLACLFWKTDNTIEVFASTPKTSPTDLGVDDINECFALRSTGSLPIWAWQLYNGQTGIASGAPADGGDDFMDLRPLWFMLQSGGGSSLSVTDGTTTVDPTTTLDLDPTYFAVSDEGSDTAGVTIPDQAANTVLAGPTTGADAAPTFRALADDDIPTALAGHAITGGSINNTPIGASTPSTGAFTNTSQTTYRDSTETSTPSTPSSDHARDWVADDNGFTVQQWMSSTGTVFTNGRDTFVISKNTSGSTINSLSPVYFTGHSTVTDGEIGGLAKADSITTLAQGVTRGSIANNAYGIVQIGGRIPGFTNAAGQAANYLDAAAAGTYTSVAPTSAGSIVQIIGFHTGSIVSGGFTLSLAVLKVNSLDASAIVSGTINEARLPHKFAVIEEQQAQNTAGGGSTATTWTTRVINTEVVDADSIVSISSNKFTPVSGTYRIFCNSPFVGNAATNSVVRLRLRNVTATSVVFVSANHFAGLTMGVNATFVTEFTANGTDEYDIQYYITVARATNGLGIAANETGAVERYTQVTLEKIA